MHVQNWSVYIYHVYTPTVCQTLATIESEIIVNECFVEKW